MRLTHSLHHTSTGPGAVAGARPEPTGPPWLGVEGIPLSQSSVLPDHGGVAQALPAGLVLLNVAPDTDAAAVPPAGFRACR